MLRVLRRRVHAGPSLASSGGPLGWGLLGGVFLGLLTMVRKNKKQSGKNLEKIWKKKTGKNMEKIWKKSGKQEMFDMCFLGVFLGAPGGPPAASLGGPRGHGREEGGETAAIS